MSDELKPCPFCGSDDVGLSRLHESRSFVMCNGCGAEADDTNTLPEASAADVWNRRVDDPLRTQLAAMTAERDQWAAKFTKVNRELGALKFPECTGTIKGPHANKVQKP